MNRRHMVMALALAGAAGLAFFGDKTPGGEVAEAVERQPGAARPVAAVTTTPANGERAVSSSTGPVAISALLPRAALLGEDGEPGADGAPAVFQSQNWNPPPPSASALAAANPPAPPPQAPPLPFVYIGKAVGDGVWEVFLTRADKTYIVRNQTVIDGQYRIERIAPPTMTMTYLPLKQVQQINIGALD
jgi:hypothetical protein